MFPHRIVLLAALACTSLALSMALFPAPAPAAVTEVLTYALSPSTQPGGRSDAAAISGDGRYVAFVSTAPNLVVGDTSTEPDIFAYDRLTGTTTLVSVDSAGSPQGGGSSWPAISGDGRYVAFCSWAWLVPEDANNVSDVFVRDRVAGTTSRVSVDSAGNEGDQWCDSIAITPDGRYVAFWSHATNLVAGDTNGFWDVFRHDRATGTTTRVSVDSTGNQMDTEDIRTWIHPATSSDGRYVAFGAEAANLVTGDTNGVADIFVRDVVAGTTERVSIDGAGAQGDGASEYPAISADGRYVAFSSSASNLVAGDTNGAPDIFVRDRTTGSTTRVSVDSSGNQQDWNFNPSISADGRFVAFQSWDDSFVLPDFGWADIFVHDRTTGMTTRVSVDSAGNQGAGHGLLPSISADGRYVAFQSVAPDLVAGDANGGIQDGGQLLFRSATNSNDIFVHDRATATTERAMGDGVAPPTGAPLLGDGTSLPNSPQAVSLDGRFVAFESLATNLVPGDTNGSSDIFVRDRLLATTWRVSVDSLGNQADGRSGSPAISADGRFVAFESSAANLVAGDANAASDVFVHDRSTGVTERVSTDTAGGQHGGASLHPSISADGRFVAFHSRADLVPVDDNGFADIYVRDRTAGTTTRVSLDSAGLQVDGPSVVPTISANGLVVAFKSWAGNLVAGDTNGDSDTFAHDRTTGATTRISVDSAGNEADASPGLDVPTALSADGRYVAFSSPATNLVAGDTNGQWDVFVHDRTTGATTRISVDSAGNEGVRDSWVPSISDDGRFVVFESRSTNFATGDWWDTNDIFLHDRTTGVTTRASVDSAGDQGFWFRDSFSPSISPDGNCVAFSSEAEFVALDIYGISDLFLNCFATLFVDGFESGDTDRWSSAVP